MTDIRVTSGLPPEGGTVEMILKLAMAKVLDEFDTAIEFQDRMIGVFGLSEDLETREAELNVIATLAKARAAFIKHCQDNNVKEAIDVYRKTLVHTPEPTSI